MQRVVKIIFVNTKKITATRFLTARVRLFLNDGAKVLQTFVKKPAKCRVYLENYVIARETVETFISSISAVDFCGARHCLRPI